jgi:hypothetical protein
VEPERDADSLHRLITETIERGGRAQRDSRALIERQHEVGAALRETLASLRERQRAAAERDAGGRPAAG